MFMKVEPTKCQHCGSELVINLHSIYCSNPLCNHNTRATSPRWERALVLEAGILSLLLGFALFAVNNILGISLILLSLVFIILSFDDNEKISGLLSRRKTADPQRIQE